MAIGLLPYSQLLVGLLFLVDQLELTARPVEVLLNQKIDVLSMGCLHLNFSGKELYGDVEALPFVERVSDVVHWAGQYFAYDAVWLNHNGGV